MSRVFLFAAMAALIGGCQQQVASPATIALDTALRQTIDAMVATQRHARDQGTNFNMRACEIKVEFSLTAVQTVSGEATLAVGMPAPPVGAGLNSTGSDVQQGTRGSVVSLKLQSDECVEWRHNARRRGTLNGAGVIMQVPVH